MTWHADPAQLVDYASGAIDEAHAASVEAHILSCAQCRGLVAASLDTQRLSQVWSEVVDVVDLPRSGLVERFLRRMGVADHTARLLAATPSLQLSWVLAVTTALAVAVVAAHENDRGLALFLVVAALAPLAGVAAAFGPETDPTYEITAASPASGVRLLLLRSCAVFATTLVVVAAASLTLPVIGWTAVAWVLPSLALSLASLALATVLRPEQAATTVAVGWVTSVLASGSRAGNWMAIFGTTGQLGFVLVIVVAAVVITLRRYSFEIGTHL
jgi:hypothetical protein